MIFETEFLQQVKNVNTVVSSPWHVAPVFIGEKTSLLDLGKKQKKRNGKKAKMKRGNKTERGMEQRKSRGYWKSLLKGVEVKGGGRNV